MMLTGRSIFNLILIVSSLVLVYIAKDYNPTARLFPITIGVLILLMSSWQIVLEWFQKKPKKTDEDKKQKQSAPVVLVALISITLFITLLYFLPYFISVPIFLMCLIWIAGKEKFLPALGVSAGLTLFMYILFDVILGVRF